MLKLTSACQEIIRTGTAYCQRCS